MRVPRLNPVGLHVKYPASLRSQLRSYYHLRNISKIRKYLTEEATETRVHTFVSSKLDYCNPLLYGLPKHMISRLQSVQNTAARIVTLTKKFDHITPVLIHLHWLPVHFRILF